MDRLELPRPHPQRQVSAASSSASSTPTHATSGSVVHHKEHQGLGKAAVKSQVLDYINNQDFDPESIYNQRHEMHTTRFTGDYNPAPAAAPVANGPPVVAANGSSSHDHDGYPEPNVSPRLRGSSASSAKPPVDDRHSVAESDADTTISDLDNFHSVEASETSSLRDSSTDDGSSQFYDESSLDDDSYDYYDDDDDMLLPPSPPRSPPRELDPDKLYGIYDFSGPDPSHLALSRDEAVFLINDQDNYWWLIRKLTKDERMEKKRRILEEAEKNNEFVSDLESVETQSDDGRIGFVPAECLETYGERLARLNCFKNEEIERYHKNPFDFDLSHPVRQFAMPLDDSGSFASGNTSTSTSSLSKQKRNVTFSQTNEIEIFSEDDPVSARDLAAIRHQQRQGVVHDIRAEEIASPSPSAADDERASEVLSDKFDDTQPLVIPKKEKKRKGPQKLYENHKDGSPLAKVRSSFSKLGSKDSTKSPSSLGSKVASAAGPELKHTNSITKDFKQSLIEKEHLGIRKIKRFASPQAESKSFKELREQKNKKSQDPKTKKSSSSPVQETAPIEVYPKAYRPSMSSSMPRRRLSIDGTKRLSIDGKKADSIRTHPPERRAVSDSMPESLARLNGDASPNSRRSSITSENVPNNLQQLRRSVILERLTKMTSDIQESLETDYGQDEGTQDRGKRLEQLRRARTQINEIKEEQRRSFDGSFDPPGSAHLPHEDQSFDSGERTFDSNLSIDSEPSSRATPELVVPKNDRSGGISGSDRPEPAATLDRPVDVRRDRSLDSNGRPRSRRESLGGTPRRLSRHEEMLGGVPRRHSRQEDLFDRERSSLPLHVSSPLSTTSGASYGTSSSTSVSASPAAAYLLGAHSTPSPSVSSGSSDATKPPAQDLAKKQSQSSVATLAQDDFTSRFAAPAGSPEADASVLMSRLYINNSDEDYEEDMTGGHSEITPLTSTNSLLSGLPDNQSNGSIGEYGDKRRSRTVHDMFNPVLDKFDELAEKLAELNEML
ncbi:hypothetical protein DIURU_004440 [Diutina rugosa]|uniref:SH3 domain-containing protein n=1 Tax=Diutina rugosa TaxID=5481 RepID=A0A642UJK4_DIURU|nr:uncharacterized protein DIURU_004440 [Diutina rugosa]KAA8899059.1 hypothetical protein DIURU_004440 [Diutina rugosa]